jgi:hypothetical protein
LWKSDRAWRRRRRRSRRRRIRLTMDGSAFLRVIGVRHDLTVGARDRDSRLGL